MKKIDDIITYTGHRYGDVKNSLDIWDHISKDNKIISKQKIFKLLDKYFDEGPIKSGDWRNRFLTATDHAHLLANISEEGRDLMREWVEWRYKKILKEKPDSFFTKFQTSHFEKLKQNGKDPYDQWYDGPTKSNDGLSFFRTLISLLRMIV